MVRGGAAALQTLHPRLHPAATEGAQLRLQQALGTGHGKCQHGALDRGSSVSNVDMENANVACRYL